MIDIFNTPTLLNPQMDYLYFLQNVRLSAPTFVSDFFINLTTIGESLFSTLFIALIYWCINKNFGEFIMLSNSFGYFLNQILKLMFCIYRPWILDSRIHPCEKAIPGAYGYSFPSGHTANVTLNFGGAAICFKSKIFRIFCFLIIVLVAFSRNFLGVHSLQDVIVGFILSISVLFLVKYFLDKADLKNNIKFDGIFTTVMIILNLAILYYISTKSYPMDYVDGKLLVDPAQMQKGIFKSSGMFMGLLLGSFIERHFIDFQVAQNNFRRIFEGIIGAIIIYILIKYVSKLLVIHLNNFGFLLNTVLIGLFITAIYPFFIKLFRH